MLQQSLLNKIKQYLIRNRYSRNFRKLVQFLCCIVVFVTTYALILPAITMEQETFCGKEEHTHSELCQQPSQMKNLICTPEKLEIHVHFEDCYDEEGTLTCGQADYIVHGHDASCYDAFGQLVCILPERSAHIHGEDCYAPAETLPEVLHVHAETCNIQEKGELICLQEEREAHFHKELCYEAGDVLECLLTENHVHDASCYSPSLSCTLSTEPHVHQDDCYEAGDLCCGILEGHVHTDDCKQEELTCLRSEGGHQHTNGCWETVQVCENVDETHTHGDDCVRTDLVCGLTEEQHYHDGSCYSVSIHCDIPENHMHGQGCYEAVKVCGKEAGETHEHATECYGGAPQLQCQQPENHTHGSACFNQILICELPEDPGHIHEDPCFLWNSVLNCGLEEGQPEPTEPAEPVLVCTEPEVPVHVHDESCFEPVADNRVLVCEVEEEGHEHTDLCYGCPLEEHVHTLICYSDPEADVETSDIWEATFAHVSLTGHGPTDLVAIAESQLGYTESIRNYEVWEDNSIHGYTRYGDWYGSPYGDWCAMFVSFCLNYADVDGVPQHWGVRPWISELSARGLYYSAKETKPQKGNLIFFDWERDGLADHVGIVADAQEAQEHTGASVKAIEGNSSDCVRYVYYSPDDPVILGYGLLPGQERIPVTIIQPDNIPDSLLDILICGMPAHAHDESCGDILACVQQEHLHTLSCVSLSSPVCSAGHGEMTRALFTMTRETASTDVSSFLRQIKVTDSNGNVIYNAFTGDSNEGSFDVNLGESYLFELLFEEGVEKQFSDGVLYYNLPPNFKNEVFGNGIIYEDGSNLIIASYQVTEDQVIITPAGYGNQNYFIKYANSHFYIKLRAEVIPTSGSDDTNINFTDNFTVNVNVKENGTLDAEKVSTQYDPNTHTINYTCTVTAKGGTVMVTYIDDWWWPKNITVNQDSIVLKDPKGETIVPKWEYSGTDSYYKLTPNTPYELKHNETLTLSYSVHVNEDVEENFRLENTFQGVGTTPNGQIYDQDTVTNDVVLTNVKKTGVYVPEGQDGAIQNSLKWDVVIDNPNLETITMRDQLGINQTFCSHHNINLKATRIDGTVDALVIPWNSVTFENYVNNQPTRFIYTLPENYIKYELTYYSHYDFDENGNAVQNFENTVTTNVRIGDTETSGTGSVNVLGVPPGISKHVEKTYADGYVTFVVTCDMPGALSGRPNVNFYDVFASWGNVEGVYIDNDPKNLEVTIVPDAEGEPVINLVPYDNQESADNTYLLQKDHQTFNIYFNTATPSGDSSVWKYDQDSKLIIKYRIYMDAPILTGWGGDPKGETLRQFLTRTNQSIQNEANLTYSPEDKVTAYVTDLPPQEVRPPISKMALPVAGEDGIYNYSVWFSGGYGDSSVFPQSVTNGVLRNNVTSLVLTDKFDSRMELTGRPKVNIRLHSNYNQIHSTYVLSDSVTPVADNSSTMILSAKDFVPEPGATYDNLLTAMQNLTQGYQYEFVYQLKVTNQAKLEATEDTLVLDNTAHIDWKSPDRDERVGPVSTEVLYDTNILDKDYEEEPNSNIVHFSILVNHYGVDLTKDSPTYVLYDTMSKNLGLVLNTLKIEVLDKNGGVIEELTPAECNFSYHSDNNQIILILPNEKIIRLKYDCTVRGHSGSTVAIGNTVMLEGRSTIQDVVDTEFKIREFSSTGGASSKSFTLQKQDGNTYKRLPHVTFDLYGDDSSGSDDQTKTIYANNKTLYHYGTYDVGETGEMLIEHTRLWSGHLFALVEREPPLGYLPQEEPYLFYMDYGDVDPDVISWVNAGGILVIKNFPMSSYELPATGGVGREVYAVGGWLLILAAGILLYNQKKCRKEDYQSS